MYKTLGGKYKSELSIAYAWNFAHAPLSQSQPQSVPEFDEALAILAPWMAHPTVRWMLDKTNDVGSGVCLHHIKEIYVLLCDFRLSKFFVYAMNIFMRFICNIYHTSADILLQMINPGKASIGFCRI